MKYIIELENKAFRQADSISVNFDETLYRVKGFRSLVFDKNGLDKLTPYDQDEAYQRGYDDAHKISSEECQRSYERGIAEAWDFARHLNAVTSDITDNIYLSANGGKGVDVALEMTYEDAKKEYDEYFQKKREKDFCVGAEVENEDGETAYVLIPDYDGCLVLSMEKYACPQIQRKHKWKCTGHVNETLKSMFEGESNED